MSKKAVIDIGSLKMKVAVFDVERRALLSSDSYFTLLGKGIDEHSHITAESLGMLDEALTTAVGKLKDGGINDIVIIGTEALRKADNVAAVERVIAKHLPRHKLRVIDQHQEAELFFEAVSRAFPDEHIVAMDVGGGSVQVVEGRFDSGTGKSTIATKHNLATGAYRLMQQYTPDFSAVPVPDKLQRAQRHIQENYAAINTQAPLLVFGSTCMLDFVRASGMATKPHAASAAHPLSVSPKALASLLEALQPLAPDKRDHFYPDGGYFMYGAEYLLMNLLAAHERIQPEHIVPTNLNSSYAFI